MTPVKDGLAKEFVIAMRVKKGPGDVAGKTLSQAGLRGIPGLHPMSIHKEDGRNLEATDYTVRMEVSEHSPSPLQVTRMHLVCRLTVSSCAGGLYVKFGVI